MSKKKRTQYIKHHTANKPSKNVEEEKNTLCFGFGLEIIIYYYLEIYYYTD
jgi:hypothetical protein